MTIIDNCSRDKTPRILNAAADSRNGIEIIHNHRNIGFGRAHNQAIMNSLCRYHIICNPDIYFSTDIFSAFVEFMDNHPDTAMAGPRFFNEDGTLQPLNRRHPSVVDLVLRRFLKQSHHPIFRKRLEHYEMRDIGYTNSYDVPFMSGAFLCCRTAPLKAVGGFDERFFLYFEDVDLSRKIQSLGFRTVYAPQINVTHSCARLAHKNLLAALIFSVSALKYFKKWGIKVW
jgi:GT2 family glycosyltransferase